MIRDRYARAVLGLVRKRYAEVDAKAPGAADILRPRSRGPLARVTTVHDAPIPKHDEDVPDRTLKERAAHALLRSVIFPLADAVLPWADSAAARETVRETFGERMLPRARVHWRELSSDRAQSWLAFGGLGAMHLCALPPDEAAADPDRAAYVVDLRWMAPLEVRRGFERYGVAAYFDHNRHLVRMFWSHGKKAVRPRDREWEHVKFAWRSSLFVATTVTDHLWGLHLQSTLQVVTATRECLSPEHPLRLLLKPHGFRTVAIGHRAAATLAPERGLPHRAFGLTHRGLADCMLHPSDLARLRPFPEILAARGTRDLKEFPFGEDGQALYGVIHDYVAAQLRLHFPDAAALTGDLELHAFWTAMARVRFDPSRPLSFDALADTVASVVFYATGMHSHVGAIVEYLVDPTYLAGRIRPGAVAGDVQSTVLTMLIMTGTALPQPKLIEDFTHLLPRTKTERSRANLERFIARLSELSERIERANDRRPLPFESFNPAHLDCSVSK